MKKIIGFLIVASCYACSCWTQQIPSQYLPANASCEAYLPNYLDYITVRNACGDVVPIQQPQPGTILNESLPHVQVTLTAINSFGNTDEEKFDVYITAFPEIIWDSIPSDTIPLPPVVDNVNELDEVWYSNVIYRAHLGDTILQDSTYKPLKTWYLY